MTYRAVAWVPDPTALFLHVIDSNDDYHFSDQTTVGPRTWREAAEARLAVTPWRVVGEWRQDGDRWVAKVEPFLD